MKLKKNILILLFTLFTLTSQMGFCKLITKDVQIQTKDDKIIKASITYNKNDKIKKYPTVLLLHSIGYTSKDWGNLIQLLNNSGYAVIAMDLRGHGQSLFNSKFKKRSWVYFTTPVFQKIPSDISLILNETQKQVKQVDINNMAMVGADLGANAAVLASKNMAKKPKTLVLISPTTNFKGLYIPIAMTDLPIPILSMVSKKDRYCLAEQKNLAKFSQGGFYSQNYPNGGMGMMMIKQNPTMAQDIANWIKRYLH